MAEDEPELKSDWTRRILNGEEPDKILKELEEELIEGDHLSPYTKYLLNGKKTSEEVEKEISEDTGVSIEIHQLSEEFFDSKTKEDKEKILEKIEKNKDFLIAGRLAFKEDWIEKSKGLYEKALDYYKKEGFPEFVPLGGYIIALEYKNKLKESNYKNIINISLDFFDNIINYYDNNELFVLGRSFTKEAMEIALENNLEKRVRQYNDKFKEYIALEESGYFFTDKELTNEEIINKNCKKMGLSDEWMMVLIGMLDDHKMRLFNEKIKTTLSIFEEVQNKYFEELMSSIPEEEWVKDK
ncbi:hypothetical protein JW949_00275 [Candidatus Woesearchaeota archaeon]|nr:hypothetical protein [Candidatus Woesearchaeota archaeon]